MSKISIEGNASGTGTITIAAPNTNSNATLTLPTASGTVVTTAGAQTIEFAAGTVSAPSITTTGDTNTGIFFPAADTIAFSEGGAEAMRIDSIGCVGIGVTPSAWNGSGNIQIPANRNYGSAGNGVNVISNAFFSGATSDFRYITSSFASLYSGFDGEHKWSTAPSGTAGNAITFTERMRINSSGNVGIGTTSPAKNLNTLSAPDTTNPSNGASFDIALPGLTAAQINSTSSGLGVNGIVGNFGGDFHLRSFWGFSIDKGAGNLASGAANTVNGDARTFAIRQYAGGTTWNTQFSVNASGNCTISGSLSKGSGSFRIDHPLPQLAETHQLVHSFIEGPQADLIYRGKVELVDGRAEVNIDTVAGMTEGTFVALNREVQCFTSNESDWGAVRGSVLGNILTIECQNAESTATISWLVIGERQDQHMYDTDWTDENGKVIVEPLKPVEETVEPTGDVEDSALETGA